MKKLIFTIVAVIMLTMPVYAASNNLTYSTSATTGTFIMEKAELDANYYNSAVKYYTFTVANLSVRTDKNCFYDFNLKSVEYRLTANSFSVKFNYDGNTNKVLETVPLNIRYTVTGDSVTKISVPEFAGKSLTCESAEDGKIVFNTKSLGEFKIKDYKFSDVTNPKSWYYNYVNSCGALGILNGMGDGSFAPAKTVTRAELASMIVRSTEHIISYRIDEKVKFSDVTNPKKWYYENVMKCASVGIILGRDDGTFAPDDYATRQEIATLVARVIKIAGQFNGGALPAVNVSELATLYPDGKNVSKFAKESVILCNKLGIMQGDKSGAFRPADNTTRAECAKIFYVVKNSLK